MKLQFIGLFMAALHVKNSKCYKMVILRSMTSPKSQCGADFTAWPVRLVVGWALYNFNNTV